MPILRPVFILHTELPYRRFLASSQPISPLLLVLLLPVIYGEFAAVEPDLGLFIHRLVIVFHAPVPDRSVLKIERDTFRRTAPLGVLVQLIHQEADRRADHTVDLLRAGHPLPG